MLNIYDILEKVIKITGIIGRILVYVGMFVGCGILWYVALDFIMN